MVMIHMRLFLVQVRLVIGAAGRASLREAGASSARMVVVRAGKSFPEQGASDADAESIGQLVEVRTQIRHKCFVPCSMLFFPVSASEASELNQLRAGVTPLVKEDEPFHVLSRLWV